MMPLCVLSLFSQICWRLLSQHPTYFWFDLEVIQNLVHKEAEVLHRLNPEVV